MIQRISQTILTIFCIVLIPLSSIGQIEEAVNAQLEAYNNRDIEAFVEQYADSVKVYAYPNILLYTGKEVMRKNYEGFFEKNPDLHCHLVNRIIQGNIVIDQEDVVVKKDEPHIKAIAIYKVKDGLIQEVTFIQ